MTGKFSNAIGVWELRVGGVSVDLRPTMGDVREFRNLLLNPKIKDNKVLLYDSFANYITGLIKRESPTDDESEIRVWVEININSLLEESMIAFRWTTRESLEKSKQESIGELKKSMSSV